LTGGWTLSRGWKPTEHWLDWLCATVFRMLDVVRVQVPAQFAEELVSAGFREAKPPPFRGGGVEPVLTLVATGAGLAADAATILVAKDAAGDLLARLRSWATRRARSRVGSELVIEAIGRSGTVNSHVQIEVRCSSADAVPEVDTHALALLLSSVFGSRVTPARENNGPPPD
jgi:hypothetical protein